MGRPKKKSEEHSISDPNTGGVARPSIEKIVAEEELNKDKKDATPDVPGEGPPKDARERCEHGRLFKCRKCDALKGPGSEEEKEAKKERLKNSLAEFHRAAFNIVALVSDDKSIQINEKEQHALGDAAAGAVVELAPEVSMTAIYVLGYFVTLGGVITGKVLEASTDDGKPALVDRGNKENGENDARKGSPGLRLESPSGGR